MALRNISELRKARVIFTSHKIQPTVPINANGSATVKALNGMHFGSILGKLLLLLAPAFPHAKKCR